MTTITDVRPDATPTSNEPRDSPRSRWERPALIALLMATAVLYLWALGSSGWANEYYAAAVQAGTQDLKAWLFGSLDAGNAITVDKPPAAMWVMALFGRLFGFSAFTMLLPEALMGVGTVALLYAAVRRWSGPAAGLMAGGLLALTPVAALMFRFNNPDALLVLLIVSAAYFIVRATETASTGWMVLAGSALGFAFLTKLLQAFLVVPGLALAFLIAAPVGLWKRVGQLAIGAVAMAVSAGWYLILVSVWPAGSRPYIAGSTDNSLLQLALGYNGLERITGGDHGMPSGSPAGAGPDVPGGGPAGGHMFFGGDPGIGRLFGASMGSQASWLLPAALVGLLAALWFTRRTARTAGLRAALLLWGGWLLVTAAIFSYMDGIIHPYYTVAMAPAIAALIGISVRELWQRKDFLLARLLMATMSAGTGVWAFVLLDRTPEWLPALRWVVLVGSVLVAGVLAIGLSRLGRTGTAALACSAILLGVLGPAAYSIETVTHAHSAGPMAVAGPPSNSAMPKEFAGHRPFGADADNANLQHLIEAVDTRWAAASVGSMGVSGLELKTGASIMAIGGFTGSDNSPTLGQFQSYVAEHQVRYFIDDRRDGPGAPSRHMESGSASDITKWVRENFTQINVNATTVYDLNAPVKK
jgi:4-amino-4-deoxy-L-arabinose transferase-like glycosyltransferase